jgi:hypothetical protein
MTTIKPVIIEHFLHIMYCNYIKILMDEFSFDTLNDILYFISKKEDPSFWNNYESFAFNNKICKLNDIIFDNDIITQINNDFMIIDIYEKNYKHYDYLAKYALHIYFQNKEKIRNELLTYVETCVGLK